MTHERIQTYTARDLERASARYLADRFGPDVPVPVDVVLLLEKTEGIDFDYWPGLRVNHQVEGMVARDRETGQLFVYIDEALADDDSQTGRGRFRMAVAEELAHFHLHRDLVEKVDSPDEFCKLDRHPQWSEYEHNAKFFAKLLLMPTKRLIDEARATFERIVQRPEVRKGLNGDARAYRRFSDPIKKQLCTMLARQFDVSESLMESRLSSGHVKVYQGIDEALESGWETLP
jgi:hypothetical protein